MYKCKCRGQHDMAICNKIRSRKYTQSSAVVALSCLEGRGLLLLLLLLLLQRALVVVMLMHFQNFHEVCAYAIAD